MIPTVCWLNPLQSSSITVFAGYKPLFLRKHHFQGGVPKRERLNLPPEASLINSKNLGLGRLGYLGYLGYIGYIGYVDLGGNSIGFYCLVEMTKQCMICYSSLTSHFGRFYADLVVNLA
jgi:hypothetical protein